MYNPSGRGDESKRMRFAVTLISLLMIVGCTKVSVPGTSHKAILMVTWLMPGQPPQTTQTALSDIAACNAAQQKAVAAGEAARAQRESQNAAEKAEAQADIQRAYAQARTRGAWLSDIGPEDKRKLQGEPLPQVSAYCIEQ